MNGVKRKGGVSSVDRLARRLEWLHREAQERVPAAVAETAEEAGEAARAELRRAPGNIPRLAETVHTEGEGAQRAVVVRHPAAPFVEFGTHRLPPRPFLQPAADRARKSLLVRIRAALDRLLGRPK